MVGKEKGPVRKGRSGGLKIDTVDKSPTRPTRPSPGRPRKKDTNSPKSLKKSSPSPGRKPTKTARKPAKPEERKALSPGRRPIRQASPARKAKEQAVKRTEVIVLNDSDSESDATTLSSTRTRSRRTLSKEPSVDIINNLRSRVRRENADLFTSRPTTTTNYEPVKRLIEFSDEEREIIPVSKSNAKSKIQIGAIVAALLYCTSELLLTYIIPLLCNEMKCEFRFPAKSDLNAIYESFDLSIFFSLTAFILFNGIISIIPFGGRKYSSQVAKDGAFEYVLNGLFALVIQLAILTSLEIYHIPITTHIVNNFFNLITSAVVFSVILGLILFVKSLYTRPENLVTPEQGHLNNFILGAELNPRFGPMDVKFVIVRVCLIGLIILALSYVYQSTEMISSPPVDPKSTAASTMVLNLAQSIRIKPTLFVLSTLMVIYFADSLVFESTLLTTMEFKSMSWGFLKCNEYLAGFLLFAGVPKYVFDYNIELQSWELLLCTVLFLIGFTLYRGANTQKHIFRENPYGPLVSRFESIPTTTGKKILCSSYWGFVRHPNYLGDILLNLALVRFAWPTPLVLMFVFIIVHLIVRAYVDNKKCRQRYGVAWERYCHRVPHMLIPKVF